MHRIAVVDRRIGRDAPAIERRCAACGRGGADERQGSGSPRRESRRSRQPRCLQRSRIDCDRHVVRVGDAVVGDRLAPHLSLSGRDSGGSKGGLRNRCAAQAAASAAHRAQDMVVAPMPFVTVSVPPICTDPSLSTDTSAPSHGSYGCRLRRRRVSRSPQADNRRHVDFLTRPHDDSHRGSQRRYRIAAAIVGQPRETD